MRAKKGSAFEREICKKLSLWWSEGDRDDIFWRSSQSGGRATLRARKGQSTYGSYGDIAAIDPIGEPLLKVFTIELKRGSSYSTAGDMIDCEPKRRQNHPFAKCILQAIKAHKRAGSMYWMLISKRDHRQIMVFFPSYFLSGSDAFSFYPRMRLAVTAGSMTLRVVGVLFQNFIEEVKPWQVKEHGNFTP